jgi:hypothetical protein
MVDELNRGDRLVTSTPCRIVGEDQMNSYALVAALGMDAVAAVCGYRLQVISEAQRRGLSLVSEARSDVVQLPVGALLINPINIRLTFLYNPDRIDLAGRMLRWGPAQADNHITRMGWTAITTEPPAIE